MMIKCAQADICNTIQIFAEMAKKKAHLRTMTYRYSNHVLQFAPNVCAATFQSEIWNLYERLSPLKDPLTAPNLLIWANAFLYVYTHILVYMHMHKLRLQKIQKHTHLLPVCFAAWKSLSKARAQVVWGFAHR